MQKRLFFVSESGRQAAVVVLAFTAGLLAMAPVARAGGGAAPAGLAPAGKEMNLYTGEGVSLGGVLFPHIHAAGVVGGSTAEEIEALAGGHHDPQSDWTVQSLELGASLRAGKNLQGFAVYSAYSDAESEFDGEFEEAFLKLAELPGGLELRGGRFYNRFGFQNASHNHAWDFVNQNLPNGRLLQEGHLSTEGAELTWLLPTRFRSALSLSYGDAFEHEHHHHHHGGEEPLFDAHGAAFADELYGAHFVAQLDYNDFYQNRVTVSGAFGDNGFGRSTTLAGIGYELLWRENGYEPGGRYIRWRAEGVYRRIGAVGGPHDHHSHDEHEEGHFAHEHEAGHDHHDHEHHVIRETLEDAGVSVSVAYGFSEKAEAGLRAEWVSGLSEMGLGERVRISPALTLALNAERTVYTRVQYDWDQFGGGADDEHSVWLQIGFNWGGPEVR